MLLCDRCKVPLCAIPNVLGPECAQARRKHCPDIQPNRGELLSQLAEIDGKAHSALCAVVADFPKDPRHVPTVREMADWLDGEPQRGEALYVMVHRRSECDLALRKENHS